MKGEKYIHHRNLLVRGQIELGIILSLVNTGMLLAILLKSVLGLTTYWTFVSTSISIFIVGICEYSFGWFYEKKKLFDVENNWLTDRTPILQSLLEKIGAKKKNDKQEN